MMYLTTTIDSTITPLIVGKFFDDGSVLATTQNKEVFHIPRFMIRTPILHCSECGRPILLKIDRLGKEFVECPNHNQHEYKKYFAVSQDVKNYNRKARHKAYEIAGKWLNRWKHQVKVNNADL